MKKDLFLGNIFFHTTFISSEKNERKVIQHSKFEGVQKKFIFKEKFDIFAHYK